MLTVTAPKFNASCTVERRVMRAVMEGTADLVVRERLEEFVRELGDEADRIHAEEVQVDFRKLEFMNSSCFKSFVGWINSVQEMPSERQYKIKLVSNAQMLWQRRSMHALKCFATDLIDIVS